MGASGSYMEFENSRVKICYRELPGRNRRLQGVSGVLCVLAMEGLWNVSLPGYSASHLFSSISLASQRNLACKACKLLEIKHIHFL